MKNKKLFSGLLAGVSMLFTLQSHAMPVHWALSNVTLSDGQTLTGGFDFDANTLSFSNISITTSGSPALSARTYDQVDNPSYCNMVTCEFSVGLVMAGDVVLSLDWGSVPDTSTWLTNAGGVHALEVGHTTFVECNNDDCSSAGIYVDDPRYAEIVSGSVSTVPLPASTWLFGSALIGLAGMRTRRR